MEIDVKHEYNLLECTLCYSIEFIFIKFPCCMKKQKVCHKCWLKVYIGSCPFCRNMNTIKTWDYFDNGIFEIYYNLIIKYIFSNWNIDTKKILITSFNSLARKQNDYLFMYIEKPFLNNYKDLFIKYLCLSNIPSEFMISQTILNIVKNCDKIPKKELKQLLFNHLKTISEKEYINYLNSALNRYKSFLNEKDDIIIYIR